MNRVGVRRKRQFLQRRTPPYGLRHLLQRGEPPQRSGLPQRTGLGTRTKKIVRAADSIGANIAEERGRHNFQDNRRFIKIARGSLNETIYWLRLAYARNLLTVEQTNRFKPIVDELSPKLNAYLYSIGHK